MTVAVKRGTGAKRLQSALNDLDRHTLKVGWVAGKQLLKIYHHGQLSGRLLLKIAISGVR